MLDGTEDRNHDGRVDADERNPNYAVDDTAQCYADAECGITTSGFVCDATHVCIAGCRGTNGNGCPDGQQCSSSNETIGTCSVVGGLGGASSIGSASSTGGNSSLGGALATGGDSSLGGALATGGDSSLGGALATGGGSSLGGALATGGGSSLGGALATGGVAATGGMAATGGAESDASLATGGSETTGGQSTTVATVETTVGAQNTNTSIEGGGCSCSVVGSRHPAGTWLTLIAGTLLFWRRRRAH
jgi:MYXO-CTERM domain-containing protein